MPITQSKSFTICKSKTFIGFGQRIWISEPVEVRQYDGLKLWLTVDGSQKFESASSPGTWITSKVNMDVYGASSDEHDAVWTKLNPPSGISDPENIDAGDVEFVRNELYPYFKVVFEILCLSKGDTYGMEISLKGNAFAPYTGK